MKTHQGVVLVEVAFDEPEQYLEIDNWLKSKLLPEHVTGAAILGNVELDSILRFYDEHYAPSKSGIDDEHYAPSKSGTEG